jgi:hypothetical protein
VLPFFIAGRKNHVGTAASAVPPSEARRTDAMLPVLWSSRLLQFRIEMHTAAAADLQLALPVLKPSFLD